MDLAIRHCSYCLKSVPKDEVKLCSKCLRRSYCSKECQTLDWSLKGGIGGQGHKNWCELGCGEEDIDWKVSPIKGKGLGIVALKNIPAKFRIMVDGCRSIGDPGVDDLMPQDGTRAEKFALNCLGCGQDDDEMDVLCLRLSRVNHSCDSNSDHLYDNELKVKILFADRDITEGEEICIKYQAYNDCTAHCRTWEQGRACLKDTFGIICPLDCICRDPGIARIVQKSKKLDASIVALGSVGQTDRALECVELMLKNHELIRSSLMTKKRTLNDGFQIAVMRKKTLKAVNDYLLKKYEIASGICHPNSKEIRYTNEWIINPRSHMNYLLLEK